MSPVAREDPDTLRVRAAEPHPTMSHEDYVAQSREVGYDLVINGQGLSAVTALVHHIAAIGRQHELQA